MYTIESIVVCCRLSPDLGHVTASGVVRANECQVRIFATFELCSYRSGYFGKGDSSGWRDFIRFIYDLTHVRTKRFDQICTGGLPGGGCTSGTKECDDSHYVAI